MPKQSAGLLPYRWRERTLEVFLVHPGGPFWAKKDAAAWSIPKGEFAADEEPLAAAQREFAEETGLALTGPFHPLPPFRAGAKTLHVFRVEADLDPARVSSNTFRLEWPPRSGRWAEFPEVDRADWFPLEVAEAKLHAAQVPLLALLRDAIGRLSS